MTRVRTFQADVEVSHEFLRLATDVAVHIRIRERLDAVLAESARGPRGGRYELFGPVTYLGSSQDYGDDWMRNVTRYAARRQGRYVRPRR